VGVGAGLYMYVVVVQKFTFAISSPDEFLYIAGYTPCPEKRCQSTFAANFAKSWPIFKILSQTDLTVNVQQS